MTGRKFNREMIEGLTFMNVVERELACEDEAYLLSDGYAFYWDGAVATVGWYELDKEWTKLVTAERIL